MQLKDKAFRSTVNYCSMGFWDTTSCDRDGRWLCEERWFSSAIFKVERYTASCRLDKGAKVKKEAAHFYERRYPG
jgi:hypothetical protein